MTFREALEEAARILSRNPRLVERGLVATESEQLLEAAYLRATGKTIARAEIFIRSQDEYPAPEFLERMAERRASGELLQHITGYQRFLNHDYEVGPEVLIPRPETEALVALAMQELRDPSIGIEIGLGSGAISIELLARFSPLKMIATELTDVAAARARANAERILGSSSRLEIRMARADQVLEPLAGIRADFLISNPPYLAAKSEVDDEVLQHEPHTALFAPASDPLFFYRKLAEATVSRVFLELPHERAEEIRELFGKKSWSTELHKDLTGRDRILACRSPSVI